MRRMRLAGHVALTWERCLQGFGRRPEGRKPLGRARRGWGDNVKMDPQEMGWGGMGWIDLAEDRDRLWALVNAVMKLRVPQNADNFLTCCLLLRNDSVSCKLIS